MSQSKDIIRLPFVRPIGVSVETFREAVDLTGRECDLCRNAMMRFWQRWREDHPEWLPDAKVDKKTGEPKRRKNGDIIRANLPAPKCEGERGEATFSTVMYQHGRTMFPRLSSAMTSAISQEVWAKLRAKTPFVAGANNRGLTVAESIMLFEQSPMSYRSRKIPVMKNTIKLGWDSCCWLEMPFASAKEPNARMRVELKVAKLPRVKKLRLQQIIADGPKTACDSEIVMGRRGGWELHLVVNVEDQQGPADAANVLELHCNDGDSIRPFRWSFETHGRDIGEGVPLRREFERVTLRRKAIRAAYRMGMIKKGHGAKRMRAKSVKESRRTAGMQAAFIACLCEDVVRAAREHNCGTVRYFEPPVRTRDKSWFAVAGVPFNWTDLLSRLKSKLQRRGIVLEVCEPVKEAA